MTADTITDLVGYLKDLGFDTSNIKLIATQDLYNILSQEEWVDESYPFGLTVITDYGNLHVIPPRNIRLIKEMK